MSRSRGWCVTINNPREEDIKGFEAIKTVYKCYEIEHEDEKDGTPHLQGYLYYKNAVRFSTVKNDCAKAHLEVAKGSPLQNYDYCGKEGKIKEIGVRPEQGKRTDIETVKEMVKAGKRMRDIVEVATSYQSVRMAEVCMRYRKIAKFRHVEVYWYHGKSGSGKTYAAQVESGDDSWVMSNDLKWFDGYDGEENVILDDLRPVDCNFNFLLKLLDKYGLRVPVKGTFIEWKPVKIWVTCPYTPEVFTSFFHREDPVQLLRRITLVKEFQGRGPVLPPTSVSLPVCQAPESS